MNILSTSSVNFNNAYRLGEKTSPQISMPKFGLKMAQPLSNDTLSFKAKNRAAKKAIKVVAEAVEQTSKEAGSYTDAMSQNVAKKMVALYEQGHKDLKRAILREYKGMVAEKHRTPGFSLTLIDRIKSIHSYREKTATVGECQQVLSALQKIQDASGFAFILEDKTAFKKFAENLTKLLKQGYTVVDYEYHRIPPIIEKGKPDITFDSIDVGLQEKLKAEILKLNPGAQIKPPTNSKAGYSAVHIIIRDKYGLDHEVQVFIRAIADVKKGEGLFYKLKSGKDVPKEIFTVSPHLINLRAPKKGKALTPEAAIIQSEMNGYAWDAYVDALSHPYTPNKVLKPDLKKYPHLANYDLNGLALLCH